MNNHSAVLYNNQMIVFGEKTLDSSHEVWMLGISGMKVEGDELLIPSQWKKARVKNPEAMSKGCGNTIHVHGDSMFVYGGHPEFNCLDLKKMKWCKRQLNLLSNDFWNEDVLHVILSYLPWKDLLGIGLVSKKLLICQLSTEDHLWKDFALKRFEFFKSASPNYELEFRRKIEEFENEGKNYRRNFILASELFMHRPFFSLAKVKSFKLESSAVKFLKTHFKIVIVGDGNVGKFTLIPCHEGTT